MGQRRRFGVCCTGGTKSGLQGRRGSRRGPGESPENHSHARKDQRQGHFDGGGVGRGRSRSRGASSREEAWPAVSQASLSRGSNQSGDLKQPKSC